MFALIKEPRMTQPSRLPQHRNRVRFPLDLAGPSAFDEIDVRHVRCTLQINQTEVSVDIPAGVIRELGLLGENSELSLRIPGEELFTVHVRPVLTESQCESAAGWYAEMSDFDRF